MNLKIIEVVNSVLRITRRETNLTIAPFDVGAGAILKSIFTGKGQLPVSSAVGEVGALAAPAEGDVLTGAPSGTYGMAWQAAGGGVVDVNVCDFRLTLESGVPASSTDQTAKTIVYMTPNGRGNRIALYSSAGAWNRRSTAEISIKTTDQQAGTTVNGSPIITAIGDTSQFVVGMEVTGTGIAANSVIATIDSATQVTLNNNATDSGTVTLTFKCPASKIYDIYCYETAALAPKLEFGPAWTNDTTRSTALAQQDGVYIKSGDPTRRWVGTIRTTATAGQVEDSVTKRYVWNYYNQLDREMYKENLTGHSYTTGAARYWNNDAANKIEFVIGVADEPNRVSLTAELLGNGTNQPYAGIGFDAATLVSPAAGAVGNTAVDYVRAGTTLDHRSGIGYHFYAISEYGATGASFLLAGINAAIKG